MRRLDALGAAVLAMAVSISGCALHAPFGEYPEDCSGVPGDDASPPSSSDSGLVTHGPAGSGRTIRYTAIARPPWGGPIPLLYAFDELGHHETPFRNRNTLLTDAAFVGAASEAYWYEGLDDGIHEVPELGPCDIAAMLGETPSFRAPIGGLLFFQFVVPGPCAECSDISRAIEALVAAHPTRPFRWVQVVVPESVGTLRED